MTASKRRILFVDNRPEFMHQPVLRLRLEGYEVEEATSGDDALAALREDGYDLLILDAELPDSDGWEVLKTVRADPGLEGQKIIVLMASEERRASWCSSPSTRSSAVPTTWPSWWRRSTGCWRR